MIDFPFLRGEFIRKDPAYYPDARERGPFRVLCVIYWPEPHDAVVKTICAERVPDLEPVVFKNPDTDSLVGLVHCRYDWRYDEAWRALESAWRSSDPDWRWSEDGKRERARIARRLRALVRLEERGRCIAIDLS